MDNNKPYSTCGQCFHFHRYGEEPRGLCAFGPPVPFPNKECAQPQVMTSRRACGQFKEGEATVKEKAQPMTVGAARRR